jgi:hypothetical protein
MFFVVGKKKVVGPVRTGQEPGLNRTGLVLCGSVRGSLIFNKYMDRFGPRFEPRRAKNRDRTGL